MGRGFCSDYSSDPAPALGMGDLLNCMKDTLHCDGSVRVFTFTSMGPGLAFPSRE